MRGSLGEIVSTASSDRSGTTETPAGDAYECCPLAIKRRLSKKHSAFHGRRLKEENQIVHRPLHKVA